MAHLHHAEANSKVTSEFNSNNYKKFSLCILLRSVEMILKIHSRETTRQFELLVNHEAVNVNLCGHTLQSNVLKKSLRFAYEVHERFHVYQYLKRQMFNQSLLHAQGIVATC